MILISIGIDKASLPVHLGRVTNSRYPQDASGTGSINNLGDRPGAITRPPDWPTHRIGDNINALGYQPVNGVTQLNHGVRVNQIELGVRGNIIDNLGAGGAVDFVSFNIAASVEGLRGY